MVCLGEGGGAMRERIHYKSDQIVQITFGTFSWK